MKAKLYQLQSLLNKLGSPYNAVIFYGTDEGEIQKGFQEVKRFLNVTPDNFNISSISDDDLKKNSLVLTDEANTVSLIGGQRILLVEDASNLTKQSLVDFLDKQKTNALLIIKSGNLSKSSALRVEAEQNPFVLAFACYPPTESDLQKTISSFLMTAKKSVSQDVLKYLTQKLSSNAGVIEQELNKLLIFIADKKIITIEDVDQIITDSGDTSFDAFCIAIAGGKTAKVEHDMGVFLKQNESLASLIMALVNYFTVLGKLTEVKRSLSEQELILSKNLRPNQFKLKEPLITQAQFWSPSAILTVLNKLHTLEKQTRTTGMPAECLFSQTCLGISEFAKKLRGLR